MLSPTPLSLFCALLLCLPLAIVFTTITPPTTTTANGSAATIPPIPIPLTTTNRSGVNPVTTATITANAAAAAASRIPPIPIPIAITTAARIPLIPIPIPITTNRSGVNPVTTATTTNGGATATIPSVPITTSTNQSSVNPITTFTPTKKRKNLTTTKSPPRPSSPAEDDDESLLRRAARVNSKPSPPRKLAFIFLTTTPLPFAPLWEIFLNQTPTNLYNIYIHADPSSPYDPPFSGVFENRVIAGSKPTRRYSPTLISAARRLLSHALLHDRANSMFALLSPSCIPLHSFNYTYKTLIRSKKSFIEILKNESGAYDRWAARGEEAMLPELPFDDFRIGSQFFVLTRKHARIVVSDRRLWSKFKLPCVEWYTCYPEEHYFPTLISMKDPRGCVPATLTHVDWEGRHDGHPRTYNASEVGPNLISALRRHRPRYGDDETNGSDASVNKRNHPFLFARKFSPESIQPLLTIAAGVIFKD